DADGARGAQGFLVDESGVAHLDAQPRDARLQIDDVRVATERREDLLSLAHCTLHLVATGSPGPLPRVQPSPRVARAGTYALSWCSPVSPRTTEDTHGAREPTLLARDPREPWARRRHRGGAPRTRGRAARGGAPRPRHRRRGGRRAPRRGLPGRAGRARRRSRP